MNTNEHIIDKLIEQIVELKLENKWLKDHLEFKEKMFNDLNNLYEELCNL